MTSQPTRDYVVLVPTRLQNRDLAAGQRIALAEPAARYALLSGLIAPAADAPASAAPDEAAQATTAGRRRKEAAT
ncbi:hypothetical protein [Blastochloris tepida]|uniref:Uncharacterized protein n=1 Tax=Blastochloris tepida TaxID=2233851 RepID=A0A348FYH5_9HYPH|nr:hypothetical protein [Blastochloris tepida]BBF92358.1 hypothetical protein BLTE_10430 [Blastochloris tepida]